MFTIFKKPSGSKTISSLSGSNKRLNNGNNGNKVKRPGGLTLRTPRSVQCNQLIMACESKDAAAALRLIEEGTGLDCVNKRNKSALMFASHSEALDEVAARLIEKGAKLDLVDNYGFSALIIACKGKRADTALLLVNRGAELNQVNRDGKTALDYADEKGLAEAAAAIRVRGGQTANELKAAKGGRRTRKHRSRRRHTRKH